VLHSTGQITGAGPVCVWAKEPAVEEAEMRDELEGMVAGPGMVASKSMGAQLPPESRGRAV